MINKSEYYKNLHQRLADKYRTTPDTILRIRAYTLNEKLTPLDICDELDFQISQREWEIKNLIKKVNFYREIIKFLKNTPINIINEIVLAV